jgi:hypothetical protein
MKPSSKGSSLLGCIDVDIGVRSSYHRPFAIFVVLIVVVVQFLQIKVLAKGHFFLNIQIV